MNRPASCALQALGLPAPALQRVAACLGARQASEAVVVDISTAGIIVGLVTLANVRARLGVDERSRAAFCRLLDRGGVGDEIPYPHAPIVISCGGLIALDFATHRSNGPGVA